MDLIRVGNTNRKITNKTKMTIYEKLLEVQKEIGAIKKDATNPFFKSKYFDINSLLEQVKPTLNKHRLILLQGLTGNSDKLSLTTKLMDADATAETDKDMKQITFTCPLPETTDAQKAGSAITYFRRYALTSLLALEAEDDDGNTVADKPSKSKTITSNDDEI